MNESCIHYYVGQNEHEYREDIYKIGNRKNYIFTRKYQKFICKYCGKIDWFPCFFIENADRIKVV